MEPIYLTTSSDLMPHCIYSSSQDRELLPIYPSLTPCSLWKNFLGPFYDEQLCPETWGFFRASCIAICPFACSPHHNKGGQHLMLILCFL